MSRAAQARAPPTRPRSRPPLMSPARAAAVRLSHRSITRAYLLALRRPPSRALAGGGSARSSHRRARSLRVRRSGGATRIQALSSLDFRRARAVVAAPQPMASAAVSAPVPLSLSLSLSSSSCLPSVRRRCRHERSCNELPRSPACLASSGRRQHGAAASAALGRRRASLHSGRHASSRFAATILLPRSPVHCLQLKAAPSPALQVVPSPPSLFSSGGLEARPFTRCPGEHRAPRRGAGGGRAAGRHGLGDARWCGKGICTHCLMCVMTMVVRV